MTYAIVAVIILIVDQAVKFWTNISLSLGDITSFIPGFIELTNVHNAGAAFGLGAGAPIARWIYIGLTIILCVIIVVVLAKKFIKGKAGRWLLVLILAGGIGNCIDRIINGYVVDTFHFAFLPIELAGKTYDFPVFNIADIFVTICGIAFCFWLIFNKTEDFNKPKDKKKSSEPIAVEIEEVRITPDSGSGDVVVDEIAAVVSTEAKLNRQNASAKEHRPPRKREERPAVPARDDYITQLKKPVAEARVILEQQRAAAAAPVAAQPVRRGEPLRQTVPETPVKPAPKKSDAEFNLDDILAEFSDK